MRRALPLAALVLLALPALPPGAAAPEVQAQRFALTVEGELATGLLALPADPAPRVLVLLCHGHHNTAKAQEARLVEAARRGAVAVAMDYRGPMAFNVMNGSEDTIAAAEHLLARFPTVQRVVILGVSMGGEVSGMAVAQRPDLFDYWINVEGLSNLAETWAEATAAGSLAGEDEAAQEIEDETGGTPAEVPLAYVERSPALLADRMAQGKLKGAVVVHPVNDGKVPYNQGREMAAALAAQRIPTDVLTVLRSAPGDEGSTATGVFGVPNPLHLAGHGSEARLGNIVMRAGDQALWALLEGAEGPPGYREFLVDAELGTVQLV